MCSQRRLAFVLVASLMLASCSASTPPVIVQPAPLPAVLLQPCPEPVASGDGSMDATGLALKGMYDLYGICAGKVAELINYVESDGRKQN